MRKEIKLIAVLILSVLAINSNAQSSAGAVATVNIVEPITVSSNQAQVFEKLGPPPVFDVLFRSGNIYLPKDIYKIPAYNSSVVAADITINAGQGDVYATSIPQKIFLMNLSGTERMTAELSPAYFSDEVTRKGKDHLLINAGVQINNGQTPGRYVSEAFDVTVNFN